MSVITTQRIQVGSEELVLEHGRFAAQANGAIVARMGDTMVLATAVASKSASSLDYFPLTVEFLERLYAGGRISTSRFIKREGRPSDDSVLTARLIDRSIRPLFPKGFKHDVQVVVTVLSVDSVHDADVLGVVAASAALAVSDIPWDGPLGSVRVGRHESGYLVNPSLDMLKTSSMDLVVSGMEKAVVMVEAGINELSEDIVLKGIEEAQKWNNVICRGINDLVFRVGKEKFAYSLLTVSPDLVDVITHEAMDHIRRFIELAAQKKLNKEDALGELIGIVYDSLLAKKALLSDAELQTHALASLSKEAVCDVVAHLFKKTIRENTLKMRKRADGRSFTEVRDLEIEVGILPRTHGSAIFRRGMTQTLTTVTLGAPSLEQLIESPTGEETKRYMHHYNFPPYSVGEVGKIGAPGRREIGHGALAERALLPVLPSEDEFPYTIRVVNEIMSSNGSSSMASVCGSSLALMDAGVPIKGAVAGVAMGLITNDDQTDYAVLTDIQGLEDAVGDMDFKVAGTAKGITALQMDIKLSGLQFAWLRDALTQAREARLYIMHAMLNVLSQPRLTLSPYAPQVVKMKIDPDMIGFVIGSGGKTINQIIRECGVTIDIEDDGSVLISGYQHDGIQRAQDWVTALTKEIKVGEVYEGKVTRILPFGAFVEILPGKEGLIHISKLSPDRVDRVEDVLQVGDTVTVRVDAIDSENRTNLTMDVEDIWNKNSHVGIRHGVSRSDRLGRDNNKNGRRY